MSSCSGCGASANPNQMICGYCGCATQDIESAADELKALNELHKVAQSMVDKSDGGVFGAMSKNMKDTMGQGSEVCEERAHHFAVGSTGCRRSNGGGETGLYLAGARCLDENDNTEL